MDILKFLIKRLLYGILVLLGLSLIIFVLTRIIPGNPARLALGPAATQEAVDALAERMHLNEPFFTQYWYWLTGALHGDLGMSLITKRNVATDIAEFLPTTHTGHRSAGPRLPEAALGHGISGARLPDCRRHSRRLERLSASAGAGHCNFGGKDVLPGADHPLHHAGEPE